MNGTGFGSGQAARDKCGLPTAALCWLVFAALAFAGLTFPVTPAAADYSNPTHPNHCNIAGPQYDFSSRRSQMSQRIQQCLGRRDISGRWVSIPACGYGGSETCAPLEEQRCILENHMRSLREICMARLQIHQQREAQRQRRLREQEDAARQQQALFMQDVLRGSVPGGVPQQFATPRQLQQGVIFGGLAAAQASGVPIANAGALHLSNAFTLVGMQVAQSIQARTLEMLESSLTAIETMNAQGSAQGPYSRDNPYPTHVRMQHDLHLAYQQDFLAQEAGGTLPFGGYSAVVGEDAQYLTEMAQARADGRLDVPLSQIGLPRDAVQQLPTPTAGCIGLNENSPNPGCMTGRQSQGASSEQLRQQRQAALRDVQTSIRQQQQADAAAAAAAAARARTQRTTTTTTTTGQGGGRRQGVTGNWRGNARNCVTYQVRGSQFILRNYCSYWVTFFHDTCAAHINANGIASVRNCNTNFRNTTVERTR